MTIRLVRGCYIARGRCEWCGARYKNTYTTRQRARGARYCSKRCGAAWNASRRVARPDFTPRARKKKRNSNALLTRTQIFAAYELYSAGMNAPEIALRGWRRWGYRSAEAAEKGLLRSWALEGLSARSGSEAMLLRESQQTCSGCGVSVGERTRGCMACCRRHWYRRQRGLPFKDSKAARPAEAEPGGMQEAA